MAFVTERLSRWGGLIDRFGVDGLVTEVKVLESLPALDAAAIASVREWEFTPALDCSRNPIASSIDIPVIFKLD